jgi:predicted Zn-dependent protease
MMGCAAGTFTHVPLPAVTAEDEARVTAAVRPLSAADTESFMRRSYYAIAYDEGPEYRREPREAFISRMTASEQPSGNTLASLTPQQLVEASQQMPSLSATLGDKVARAKIPLTQRLNRVARRVSDAAGRPDLLFSLDPRAGLNASALAGFDSHQIVVGPQIILASETDDGLAFILGHEVAHIARQHTRSLTVQQILVGTLQAASVIAVAAANAESCSRGGACMGQWELGQSMDAAAAVTGLAAHGTIQASGFGRDQEREADYYGLQYMKSAGYDPNAAALVFQRLLAVERGSGATYDLPFLQDHPATSERVARLQKWAGTVNPAVTDSVAEPSRRARVGLSHPQSAIERLRSLEDLSEKGLVTKSERREARRRILREL